MSPVRPAPSVTGGSAASQAESLDARAWAPRRWLAVVIQALMFAIPLVAGFVSVGAAIRIVERPPGRALTALWIVLLVVVSTVAAHIARRFVLRLAPLSALFRLSLVFPDKAPSRFRTALLAGSGRRLSERAARSVGVEQAAAEETVVLLAALSRHDRMTRGHSERVRAYSVMLGEEIGLSRADIDKLNWAALIHDIGKLEVAEEILNKAGRPTAEEWAALRVHPRVAAGYVESLRPWLGEWVDAATQHHERWDGAGYPAGLTANEISLAGRIVSIADAFDVMTATRAYKKPLPSAQARAELISCAGSQFDPVLVRAFLRISLGRTQRFVGPLAWLSHLPELVRTPVVAAANSGHVAVAASVVAVAAAAGAIAPLPTVEGAEVSSSSIERVTDAPNDAVAEPTTTVSAPLDEAPPTTTSAPERAAPAASSGSRLPMAPTSSTAAPETTTTIDPTTTTSEATTSISGEGVTAPPPTMPVDPAEPTSSTTIVSPTSTSTSTSSRTTTTSPSTTTTTAQVGISAMDDADTVIKSNGWVLHVTQNDEFGLSDIDVATLEVITSAERGMTVVVGRNIRYTPNPGEQTGTDMFVYRVCSVAGYCDTATVLVTLAIP